MVSSPFQHRGRQMVPTRGQSWTVGWWLEVSEIGRQCCGYNNIIIIIRHGSEARIWRSTLDRRHIWNQTLSRHKYLVFQSYWLEDMALCEAWVLGLFPWSNEYCSAACRMTWGVHVWLSKCTIDCNLGRNHVFKVGGSVSLVYGITTLLQKKLDRSTQFGAVGYIITLCSS